MTGTCTNVLAEVHAAVLGLRRALQLHKTTGVGFFDLLTDSMFVVQTIEDDLVAWRHAGSIATLLQVWMELRCQCEVVVTWVKGHAGHLLNELADRHAKAMVGVSNSRVDYRYALSGQDLPAVS